MVVATSSGVGLRDLLMSRGALCSRSWLSTFVGDEGLGALAGGEYASERLERERLRERDRACFFFERFAFFFLQLLQTSSQVSR